MTVLTYTAAIHRQSALPFGPWNTPRLETANPRGHIDDTYYYGAQCRQCEHGARLIAIEATGARSGTTYPLAKVRERLRCEGCRCSRRRHHVLAPDQRTGNLVELFARKPGG